ncbi:MAG: hypothetical protein LUQ01_04630 [Methanolinea sp.]|nr:hypothetical protein [Methanolinea sp.]
MFSLTARSLLLVLVLAAICLSPASASENLRQLDVVPSDPVLSPGTGMNISATIEILPSGASTFPEGHSLTLNTDLQDPRWNVAVMVDGHQAAVIPKQGDVVFVNGFLLSYPDTRDVAVRVALEGIVPWNRDGQPFIVLRIVELNNQGYPVGGSDQEVSRTVSHMSTPSPNPTTISGTIVPPTKAAHPACLVLLGIILASLWAVRREP